MTRNDLAQLATRENGRSVQFATALAHGVSDFRPEDLAHGALTLSFGLSAWMRRTSVGIDEAWTGVLLLRTALLQVAGFDRASEPIPLRTTDDRTAFVSTTVYLDGLLGRAAHALGKSRKAVTAEVISQLVSLS